MLTVSKPNQINLQICSPLMPIYAYCEIHCILPNKAKPQKQKFHLKFSALKWLKVRWIFSLGVLAVLSATFRSTKMLTFCNLLTNAQAHLISISLVWSGQVALQLLATNPLCTHNTNKMPNFLSYISLQSEQLLSCWTWVKMIHSDITFHTLLTKTWIYHSNGVTEV